MPEMKFSLSEIGGLGVPPRNFGRICIESCYSGLFLTKSLPNRECFS